MDAIAAIQQRYSCREYQPQAVPREMLEQIIDAGRRAPSARKELPVEFVVITDPATRTWIGQTSTNGAFIASAGACVMVIARDVPYYLEDGCGAVENVLLAATALGLQSCWVAGDKKPYARAMLDQVKAPENYKLIALLAVGYGRLPGQQPPHRSLQDVLHWETF